MISIFLLGVLGVFLVWTLYYRKHWAEQLEAEVAFGQDVLYAGQQTEITERIENRKRMPVPVLEVAFQVRKEIRFLDLENTAVSDFTYKRDVFSMLGRQRITRRLAVECRRRGHYRIEKVDFTAYSLLHTWIYTVQQQVETSVYVYAKRTDVSELTLCCEKMLGARQCARRLYEDPFAFRGIREYTVTDPMKTINWKASAKSGELMVNTFDSTLTEQVMIYLNVADEGIIKHENLIEEGISVAASLAQKLIGKGMEVGIAVNVTGEKYRLSPAGGRGQLTSIERMLAELDWKAQVISYESILTELPEGAMPVFISRNTEGIDGAVTEFLGKEQEGIWVVPMTAAELSEEKAKGQREMQHREAVQYEDMSREGQKGYQRGSANKRLKFLVRKVAGA